MTYIGMIQTRMKSFWHYSHIDHNLKRNVCLLFFKSIPFPEELAPPVAKEALELLGS